MISRQVRATESRPEARSWLPSTPQSAALILPGPEPGPVPPAPGTLGPLSPPSHDLLAVPPLADRHHPARAPRPRDGTRRLAAGSAPRELDLVPRPGSLAAHPPRATTAPRHPAGNPQHFMATRLTNGVTNAHASAPCFPSYPSHSRTLRNWAVAVLAVAPNGQRDRPETIVMHGLVEGGLIHLEGCSHLWEIVHLWHDGTARLQCKSEAWVRCRTVRLLGREPQRRGHEIDSDS